MVKLVGSAYGVGYENVDETVVIVITGRDPTDRANGHDIGLDAFRRSDISEDDLSLGNRGGEQR